MTSEPQKSSIIFVDLIKNCYKLISFSWAKLTKFANWRHLQKKKPIYKIEFEKQPKEKSAELKKMLTDQQVKSEINAGDITE